MGENHTAGTNAQHILFKCRKCAKFGLLSRPAILDLELLAKVGAISTDKWRAEFLQLCLTGTHRTILPNPPYGWGLPLCSSLSAQSSSSGPEIFQRMMSQLLSYITGVVCDMDDILV